MAGRGLLVSDWADNDEVTITYRTLKQMALEAGKSERERIAMHLYGIYYEHLSHHSQNASAVKDWNLGFKYALDIVNEGLGEGLDQ
jgi:hypothetical protein